MAFIVDYQWYIFITVEILSWVMLLFFGVCRYVFQKKRLSNWFILLFIFFIFLEAVLALVLYQETGEISDFQIIIIIFVLYACTFGITDFRKLDRWMRGKIGNWRGVDLLTEKDKYIIQRQKDPKHIARKYRISSTIHTIIFIVVQAAFWLYGTGSIAAMIPYITDLSWYGTENINLTPYPNEVLYYGSMVWSVVFAIDFIWSWSYTIFPSKPK